MKLSGPAVTDGGVVADPGGGTWTDTIPRLSDAMRAITDLLVAAGIRVTWDMKTLNPPCVFMHPPELSWRFRGGDMTVSHHLLLMCSAGDRTASFDRMSDLLIQVQDALGDRAVAATPEDVETSDLSTFLTAYGLRWAERVRQR